MEHRMRLIEELLIISDGEEWIFQSKSAQHAYFKCVYLSSTFSIPFCPFPFTLIPQANSEGGKLSQKSFSRCIFLPHVCS